MRQDVSETNLIFIDIRSTRIPAAWAKRILEKTNMLRLTTATWLGDWFQWKGLSIRTMIENNISMVKASDLIRDYEGTVRLQDKHYTMITNDRLNTYHVLRSDSNSPIVETIREMRCNLNDPKDRVIFFGTEFVISGRKVTIDRSLGERIVPDKFGCTGLYRVEMQEEQANK